MRATAALSSTTRLEQEGVREAPPAVPLVLRQREHDVLDVAPRVPEEILDLSELGPVPGLRHEAVDKRGELLAREVRQEGLRRLGAPLAEALEVAEEPVALGGQRCESLSPRAVALVGAWGTGSVVGDGGGAAGLAGGCAGRQRNVCRIAAAGRAAALSGRVEDVPERTSKFTTAGARGWKRGGSRIAPCSSQARPDGLQVRTKLVSLGLEGLTARGDVSQGQVGRR